MVDNSLPKQFQEELYRLRKTMLMTREAIFMTDREGVIVFVNSAFTQLYGYSAEEVVDQVTPRILKSGHMTLDEYASIWQTLLNKESFSGEFINKTKDGRYLHIEASANPILSETGEIIGFLAIQRDVTEKKQAEEAFVSYSKRLEVMRSIDRAILQEISSERIAAAALGAMRDLIPSIRTSVTLFDSSAHKFEILATHGGRESTLGPGMRVGPAALAVDLDQLQQGQTHIVDDIQQLDVLGPVACQLISEEVRSCISVPLLVQGELVGCLNLGHDKPGAYGNDETRIIQDVANQLAIAIHQSQLIAKSDARRQRLATLLQVSQALATTIELEPVLQLAIDQSVSALGLETGAIYLLRGEELYLGATTPPLPPDMPEEFRVAQLAHHPHIGRALSTGEPLYVSDTDTVDLTPQEQEISRARGLRSLLYVPLPVGQRMVGVLIMGTVGRVQAFSAGEIEMCQTLSVQVALAVENAQLHHRTKLHAIELEEQVADRTKELITANRQLEALSRLKDEFVSSVSHELRSPITSIKLYHGLMRVKLDKVDDYHRQLGREIDRLSDLIENLLQLSRIDQGFLKVELTKLDLNDLATQYAADRLLLARERGLTLDFVESGEPLVVMADKILLGEVLSILITNAINYTPPQGKIEVCVNAYEQDNNLWGRVDVSDTGLGISAEEMPRIFDRFFRGRAGSLSEAPGTGLGLAIAKENMERHGGRIAVASPGRLGSGSTFSIWLPAITE